ncbi:histidine kinase [Tunicatimonas pelagia]|uniref:histidine kinase n=1 Tax=Tunicatimonas pelagia TaxID=931531 RepID=UPI0026655A65|nr:histidine kinase [Tunicatimonas pelagia]WKN40540.1 histidine kinase [Tunicatimonas pelagia]
MKVYQLKLERWLALALFSLTVFFVGAVSIGFYTQLRNAVLERTQNQLLSINILKKRLVEQYLTDLPPSTENLSALRPGLEAIVTERTGMGATGESYLVNPQGQMLTVSRFFPDSLPESINVDTQGFQRALAGQRGVDTYVDYRGNPIIGAYQKIQNTENAIVLLTEIDIAEAMQPITSLRNRFIVLSLSLLLLSWFISTWLAKVLSRPILSIKKNINSLVQGKLPEKPIKGSQIQEINSISESLNEFIRRLNHTIQFAQNIGQGNFSVDYCPLSDQDRLGNSLLTMREQLVQLNAQKEQLERETKKVLISAQETERERFARDIHDGVGPLLTTAKLKISTTELSKPVKQEVAKLLDEVITEIRRISSNLMPAVLRDFGPGAALQQLVREIEKNSSISIHYANDLLPQSRISKEGGIALYRIAQEAINNTLKHAQATEVVMSLTEFDNQVVLFYKDNGQGIDVTKSGEGVGKGLRNIRERVRILDGTVEMFNDNGAVIEVEIPIT